MTTSEEFITRSALYVPESIDGFQLPERLSFRCDRTESCKNEATTTWSLASGPEALTKRDFAMKMCSYFCSRCSQNCFTVLYRDMKKERREAPIRYMPGSTGSVPGSPYPATVEVVTVVMKIGQYPALSIALPPTLEDNLGKEAALLYRRGLMCRHSGFGLAAVAYIRRVVEDKTNELIEVAASLAEARGGDAAVVAKMRAAANSKEYTPYTDKLKIAADVYPDKLKAGTINPLERLYSLGSAALHGLSEERCIEIADQITGVFEFVFSNLRAEVKAQRTFEASVKQLGSS